MKQEVLSIPGLNTEVGVRPSLASSPVAYLRAETYQKLRCLQPSQRMKLFGDTEAWAFDRGLRIDQQPVPLIHVPSFYDGGIISEKAQEIKLLRSALMKLENFAFSGKLEGRALLEEVAATMDPTAKNLMLNAQNVKQLTAEKRIARMDTFFNELTGEIKVIEVNAIAIEGLWQQFVVLQAGDEFLKGLGIDVPEVDEKNASPYHVYRALISEFTERKPDQILKTIGIMFEDEGDEAALNHTELPFIAEEFKKYAQKEEREIKILLGHPSEVEISGDLVYLRGLPIDVVWRNDLRPELYHGIGPNETAIKYVQGLREMIAHPERFVILNDERARFMGNKVNLANLHNPVIQEAVGINDQEKEAITKTIPFTFDPKVFPKVEYDGRLYQTMDYLFRYCDQYVLKPTTGYSGANIHFGLNSGSTWKRVIHKAIEQGGYIVQRYVPYDFIETTVPVIDIEGNLVLKRYYQDMNLHVIGGSVPETFTVRAIPAEKGVGVLNVSAGAGMRPGIVVR